MNQRSLQFLQQMKIDVWQSRQLTSPTLTAARLLVVSDQPAAPYKRLLQGICLALNIDWQQLLLTDPDSCPIKHTGWLIWASDRPCPLPQEHLLMAEPLENIAASGSLKRQLWQRICHDGS